MIDLDKGGIWFIATCMVVVAILALAAFVLGPEIIGLVMGG